MNSKKVLAAAFLSGLGYIAVVVVPITGQAPASAPDKAITEADCTVAKLGADIPGPTTAAASYTCAP